MKATIQLTEVRKQILTGASFSCKYFTYSAQRKEGGELKTMHEARLLTEARYCEIIGKRPLTVKERKDYALEKEADGTTDMKWAHGIRHFQIMISGRPTGDIRPVRPLFIQEFNGKIVI